MDSSTLEMVVCTVTLGTSLGIADWIDFNLVYNNYNVFRSAEKAHSFLLRSFGTGVLTSLLKGKHLNDEDIDKVLIKRPSLQNKVGEYFRSYGYNGKFRENF